MQRFDLRFPLLLGLALLLMLSSPPAPAAPAPALEANTAASDLAITDALNALFADDADLRHARLRVDAHLGYVHIAGDIPSVDSAARVIELAESVEGIAGVIVQLTTD